MGTISRTAKAGGGTNFNAGQTIDPDEVNTDLNTAYTLLNGEIDDANIKTAELPGSKSLRYTEISDPSTPSSNDVLQYAKDDGNGITRLYTKDAAGTVSGQTLASAEATTTSTSSADLTSFTSLSIPVTRRIVVSGSWRKTAGHASSCSIGLKLNGSAVINPLAVGSANNQAESGVFTFIIQPQRANYLRAFSGSLVNGTVGASSASAYPDADLPNATITSITVTGLVANAGNTLAVHDVRFSVD